MEGINDIASLYIRSKKTEELFAAIEPEKVNRILVKGFAGSQESLVISALLKKTKKNILVIAADKDEAAYLYTDIESILSENDVHFFPDSFKRPLHFEQLNPTNTLQRTETINRLSEANFLEHITVTYPEALFEKVVDPIHLNKSKIEIAVDSDLDVDFLVNVLVEYGFERVDFVYEPGQFSIRGFIVDIFSYGNELPYRIELFDVMVESIRLFNPSTQLSEKKVNSIAIVPNINAKFNMDQKVSLLRILPLNTILWVHDFQNLVDKLQTCFERAMKYAEQLSYEDIKELKDLLNDRSFIKTNEIIADALDFSIISTHASDEIFQYNKKLDFKCLPQPSFNKNFELLIKDLLSNTSRGIKNYIFSDNAKQIDRFEAIFKDLGQTVQLQPIMRALHQGFTDEDLRIACYTDHQIFNRYHSYKIKKGFSREYALNSYLLKELTPGDYVTHIDHGVGKFSGLEKININGQIQESIRLVYKNSDLLYVGVNSLHKLSKYIGKEGTPPTLSKLGSDTWANMKRSAKKKVKDIAAELIKLYALRKASKGFQFAEDNYQQVELEASFMYEDTPDQYKATVDVKHDMEQPHPMDRLVCGDVGFGKTEIAIRASFKAVAAGKQVAILAPTRILVNQHQKTFAERLEPFGVKVEHLNSSISTKKRKEVIESLVSGKTDIIIGTQGILGKDMQFKDLGLLIIDEEQKFGVAAKEKLKSFKVNVDTLTLTATPIPRTLQFSLMAARDLSVIRTPPPNRQPINTEIRVYSIDVIKEAIYEEVGRGGQVYFVHNRVSDLPDIVGKLKAACPDVAFGMAHGQMDNETLEEVIESFIEKEFDVLVSTNIVGTGIDISNANTIIINNAHNFGMSDLHQLRGRVGRSNRKAYCYLFCPPMSLLTNDAKKRLKTIEEFSELGSGFNIAMKDLDIRGAGNILGGEQSGFIADIGYETYQKILEEAIHELKENEFKDIFKDELDRKQEFVLDVQIDTDFEMHIPNEYIDSSQERLRLYSMIDEFKAEEDIQKLTAELKDRFGKLPWQVEELFDGIRLRWAAKNLGIEKIFLKNSKLNCYFIGNPQSPFYETKVFQNILNYVNKVGKTKQLTMKQSGKYLILTRENVRTLNGAKKILELIKGVSDK